MAKEVLFDEGDDDFFEPSTAQEETIDRLSRNCARLTRERDDLREALTWIRRHIESTEEPNIDKIHTVARHMKLANTEKETG